VKDPEDGNLDRIQIVKGWTKSGQIFEKIYDVAWSGNRKPDPATGKVPAVGNTVDVKNATYSNTIGAVELKTVWTDPAFDPSLHAFYYARVLQIPTPRWTTYDAKKLGVHPPADVPTTVQERAWTSPIWFSPSAEASRMAPRGTEAARSALLGLRRLSVRSLQPEAFLFQHDGKPLSSMAVHRSWRRVLLAAQVRYRSPEQLRHTFASTLLSRNAPLLYVQQQGGWRSASVLLRVYARWMPQPSATQAQPAPFRVAGTLGGNAR
jgi:hypothetical protein